jgi:hypothetical protein
MLSRRSQNEMKFVEPLIGQAEIFLEVDRGAEATKARTPDHQPGCRTPEARGSFDVELLAGRGIIQGAGRELG